MREPRTATGPMSNGIHTAPWWLWRSRPWKARLRRRTWPFWRRGQSTQFPDVLMEFRALHNQGSQKEQTHVVLPWRMQVSWRLLDTMIGLNAWILLGARLKQCTAQPSALATTVNNGLRNLWFQTTVMAWVLPFHRSCWPIRIATATPTPLLWQLFGVLGHRLTSTGPCLGRNKQSLLSCFQLPWLQLRTWWHCFLGSLPIGMGMDQLMPLSLYYTSWLGVSRNPCLALGHVTRRLDSGEEKAQIFDAGKLRAPITLQNDTSARHVTLQSLLDAWTKEHGMRAGLDQESSMLRLHIDRFFLDSAGHRQKFCFQVDVGHRHTPLFNADGMTYTMLEYVPVSMILHAGDANAGHYRALLCMHSGHTVDEDAARHDSVWAYTDDNVPAEVVKTKTPGVDLLQNVVIVWLILKSHVQLRASLHSPAQWPLFLRELKKWQHSQRTFSGPAQIPSPTAQDDPMAALLAGLPALWDMPNKPSILIRRWPLQFENDANRSLFDDFALCRRPLQRPLSQGRLRCDLAQPEKTRVKKVASSS